MLQYQEYVGKNPYNYTTIYRDPLGIWGYGWGESESLKTPNNLEGHFGKWVLGGVGWGGGEAQVHPKLTPHS